MSNGEIKRYDLDWNYGDPIIDEDMNGDYVKHSDYAAQASAIVALKEQLAAARNDALEEAAKVSEVLTRIPSDLLGLPPEWMARTAGAGARIAAAIRAIASQPAAPVQPQSVTMVPADFPIISLGKGMIEVGQGHQDGVPAILFGRNGAGKVGVETEGDRTMEPGECLAAITFGNPESLDVVAEKLAELRARVWTSALATTRPSAALSDHRIMMELSKVYTPPSEPGNSLLERVNPADLLKAVRAILAASSGALAVPEEKFTKHQAIVISGYTGFLACSQFSDLHADVEKRLGQPVWTHQFADPEFKERVK